MPFDPQQAVLYGDFVQTAYTMYTNNPNNLTPPPEAARGTECPGEGYIILARGMEARRAETRHPAFGICGARRAQRIEPDRRSRTRHLPSNWKL